MVRAQPRGGESAAGRDRAGRPRRPSEHAAEVLPRPRRSRHHRVGRVSGRGARGSRGRRLHPDRRGARRRDRRRADHLDLERGHLLGPGGALRGRRRVARARRRQEPHRLDRHLSGGDREARHHAGHARALGDGHRGHRSWRRAHAQGDRPASPRRDRGPDCGNAGGARQHTALRDLHRGVRGLAASPRSELRAGGGRRSRGVARPAGRIDQDRGRRDRAPHQGAGLPRPGVRRADRDHQPGRQPCSAARGCRGHRRLPGHRPAAAFQRHAGRHRAGLPGGRPGHHRDRHRSQALHRAGAQLPAGGRRADDLERWLAAASRSTRHAALQRAPGLPDGAHAARALLASSTGLLGGSGDPRLLSGRPVADPSARDVDRRHFAFRLHRGAGHPGRRRDRDRRERLPEAAQAERPARRGDRRNAAGLGASHLRRSDDRRRLHALSLRPRNHRPGPDDHRERGDVLPVGVIDRVAARPACAPGSPQRRESAGRSDLDAGSDDRSDPAGRGLECAELFRPCDRGGDAHLRCTPPGLLRSLRRGSGRPAGPLRRRPRIVHARAVPLLGGDGPEPPLPGGRHRSRGLRDGARTAGQRSAALLLLPPARSRSCERRSDDAARDLGARDRRRGPAARAGGAGARGSSQRGVRGRGARAAHPLRGGRAPGDEPVERSARSREQCRFGGAPRRGHDSAHAESVSKARNARRRGALAGGHRSDPGRGRAELQDLALHGGRRHQHPARRRRPRRAACDRGSAAREAQRVSGCARHLRLLSLREDRAQARHPALR